MLRLFRSVISLFCSTSIFMLLAALMVEARQITPPIIISEVAWGGTISDANDEWIELYNRGDVAVALDGWTLRAADGTPSISLAGTIEPNAFFLLERSDDTAVLDVAADLIYSNALANDGESLQLLDEGLNVVDSANGDGGEWPAGTNDSARRSMERSTPDSADSDQNWLSNNQTIRNGVDKNSVAINGTPRQSNSAWQATDADLAIQKFAPLQVQSGDVITYQLVVQNIGQQVATGAVVTDSLPDSLTVVTATGAADIQPDLNRVVWQLGTVEPRAMVTVTLTTTTTPAFVGLVDNVATTTTRSTEVVTANNRSEVRTLVGSVVLINAVHFYALDGGDEAVQLINLTDEAVDLTGWILSDGSASAELPATSLAAHQTIWIADNGDKFAQQFGFSADLAAADLIGSWPGFANGGDEVYLRNRDGTPIDTLVYEEGATTAIGWDGVAVTQYDNLGTTGQIVYRMLDEQTGLPVKDSDSAEDWANASRDLYRGRKVRFPGWDFERYFQTTRLTETSQITISVSPDSSHNVVTELIRSASTSIKLEIFSITNLSIARELFAAAERGVQVELLLEGAPPGGLIDQVRYICAELEARGGDCWFMISESDQDIYDRYRFLHAKFMIVDEQVVLVSSDNFSGSSMPYDDFADGTSGRRGVQLQTNAPGVVAHFLSIWHNDFDPINHHDIFPWTPDHITYGNKYGDAATGYIPDDISGGVTYTVRYPVPAVFTGTFAYEIIQSPENSLRASDGLIGLLSRAGAGDTVYVQQLDERPRWGSTNATEVTDPNPRLEAYIAAARRGADVWIMLDAYLASQYFSPTDTPDNADVCSRVATLVRDEGLKLRCQLTNPTDLGIHNKMVLAHIGGQGYIHIGSLNGTEQSSKGNREVAIQVQSDAVYQWLADLFIGDWEHRIYVPIVVRRACDETMYPLISEVFYNPAGVDDSQEFIEVVNPTCRIIDLTNYAVGDAVALGDFEDVRRFPNGSRLGVMQAFVVAQNGLAFAEKFGRNPDFEILDSSPDIPNMIDDPNWDANALLRLGNSGDEVLLRDPSNAVVDAVTYGSGTYPGVVAAPLLSGADRSLERTPAWKDTNNGVNDMREGFPTPGELAR